MKVSKQVIIIGCPRSGTTFMKRLLEELGMLMGHNSFRPDGVVAWEIVYMFPIMNLEGHTILHQVRHPLRAISSIHTHKNECRERFRRYIDVEDTAPGSIAEDMLFWVKWNELCEKYAEWRFRIEDINFGGAIYRQLCEKCGVEPRKAELLNRHDVNTRRPAQLTMEDLRGASEKWASRVEQKAKEYGYTI